MKNETKIEGNLTKCMIQVEGFQVSNDTRI